MTRLLLLAAAIAAGAALRADELGILLFGHSFGVDSTEHLLCIDDTVASFNFNGYFTSVRIE